MADYRGLMGVLISSMFQNLLQVRGILGISGRFSNWVRK